MAALTFRLANSVVNNFGELVDGVNQTAATLTTGWIVAKNATGLSSEMDIGVEQAGSTFSANGTTPKPSGLLTGASANAWRSTNPYSGEFANANWTITVVWRSVTAAHTGTIRVRVRVFKSVNADGTGATELTGTTQVGTTSGAGSTTVDVSSAVTWAPGSVLTFNNEYLFIAVAMEIVTASGSNSADADLRTGSGITTGTRVLTSDFVSTDAATVNLALVPSGTDSYGTADSDTVRLNLTPGATHQYIDAEFAEQNLYIDTSSYFDLDTNLKRVGQSIIPAVSGRMISAAFFTAKVGNPTDSLLIELYDNNVDRPGSLLGQATISNSALSTTFAFVDGIFTTPPNVVAGTTYWLVVRRSGSTDLSNEYRVRPDTVATHYTKGSASTTTDGGSIWNASSVDYAFTSRILIAGAVASVVLVPSGTDVYTPSGGVETTDSATVNLKLTPSGTDQYRIPFPVTNNFDGGTNGTGITPSNSGGASGTAFTSIGGAPTYDSVESTSSPLSGKFPLSAGAEWMLTTSSIPAVTRIVVKFMHDFADQLWEDIEEGINLFSPDSEYAFRLSAPNSTGPLTNKWIAVYSTPLGGQVYGGVAITPNVWHRLEITVNRNTNQIVYDLYLNVDGTTPDETKTYSTTPGSDTIDHILLGHHTGTLAGAFHFDDVTFRPAPITDTDTVRVSFTPSGTDEYTASGAQYTDNDTILIAFTPSSTEVHEIPDADTVPLLVTVSGSETQADVDSNTVLLALAPSGTEFKTGATEDADTALISIVPSTTEVAATIDSAIAALQFTPSSLEGLSALDTNTARLALTPNSGDASQLVDANTVPVVLLPSGTEIQAGIDADTTVLRFTPASIDIQLTGDSDTTRVALSPSSNESFAGESADASTISLILTASGTDVLAAIDAATGTLILTPFGTETRQTEYTDAAACTLKFSPSTSDTAQFTDGGTASINFAPSGTDTLQAIDDALVPLQLTPASTDILPVSDFATTTLNLQPSGTETSTLEDAVVVTLVLIPSATETREVVDVGEIYLRLTVLVAPAIQYVVKGIAYLRWTVHPGVVRWTARSYKRYAN